MVGLGERVGNNVEKNTIWKLCLFYNLLSSNSRCYQISFYNPSAIFIDQRDHENKARITFQDTLYSSSKSMCQTASHQFPSVGAKVQ